MPDPLIDISQDNHVHTRLCQHAVGEMEDYVLQAIDKGLKKIIFLEHMEGPVQYMEKTWLDEDDFDIYFSTGQKLQKIYENQIQIGLGVEVGFSPDHADSLHARLGNRQWDQIGISYHFMALDGFDNHLNLVSRKSVNLEKIREKGHQEILSHYFTGLIQAVEMFPGTMVCHLDAALRHMDSFSYTREHWQLIETLFDTMQQQGASLEVNTSGFKVRDVPFPGPAFIKMAVERGIGLRASSDAHKPEDVGRYFDRLQEYIVSSLH